MKSIHYLFASVIVLFAFNACDPEPEEPVAPRPELLACEEMSDNWEVERTESDFADRPTDIFYLNENTAIAIKETDILRTTDGGTTWSIISRYFLPDGGVDSTALTAATLRHISQDDEGVLYISGDVERQGNSGIDPATADGVVLYSTDLGLTWGKRYLSENLSWVKTSIFFGNGRGFLVGRGASLPPSGELSNGFFETYDGGVNWTPILPEYNLNDINNFKTSPEGNIYWIAKAGREFTLVIFDRISQEWSKRSVPGSKLFYATEAVVFCQDIDRKILKSTDGGLTWEEYEEIVLGEYDNLHIYSAGEDNWLIMVARLRFLADPENMRPEPTLAPFQFDVHETTDGGESWAVRYIANNCLYNTNFRYFENIGYVVVCCNGKHVIRFNP